MNNRPLTEEDLVAAYKTGWWKSDDVTDPEKMAKDWVAWYLHYLRQGKVKQPGQPKPAPRRQLMAFDAMEAEAKAKAEESMRELEALIQAGAEDRTPVTGMPAHLPLPPPLPAGYDRWVYHAGGFVCADERCLVRMDEGDRDGWGLLLISRSKGGFDHYLEAVKNPPAQDPATVTVGGQTFVVGEPNHNGMQWDLEAVHRADDDDEDDCPF